MVEATLTHGQSLSSGRSDRAWRWVTILSIFFVLVALWSLTVGATDLNIIRLFNSFFGIEALSRRDEVVLYQIRFPRLIMGMLVGASLACSGAIMQGLFRNPLADPGVVGVSLGASLGAVIMIVLGNSVLIGVSEILGVYDVPIAACIGAWTFTLILYAISSIRGQTSVALLLLGGIALGAIVGAIVGLITYFADDNELRELTFWNMGSLAGVTWPKVISSAPLMVIVLMAVPFLAKMLNGFAMGEAVANHIGINVQNAKRVLIVAVAISTGAAVAVSGGIGFIGLVSPHLVRVTLGPDHRYLLPAAGLIGAILLIVADSIARVIIAPAELPLGIITAIIGGPFFIWMLLRGGGTRL